MDGPGEKVLNSRSFWLILPALRSEGRICVNPCEFNVVHRGMPHPLGQDPDAGSRSCDASKSCQKNRPIDTSLSVYDLVRQPHKYGNEYKG